MKLSNDEWILLSHLRNDARKSLVKIADETNMPMSTVYEKLRQFERDFIKKHTCIIDFERLGFKVKANIALKLDKNQRYAFLTFIENETSVNSAYKINNNYDFMLECVFRDYEQMKLFLENIDEKFKVENKIVHQLIECIKYEDFMANKSHRNYTEKV